MSCCVWLAPMATKLNQYAVCEVKSILQTHSSNIEVMIDKKISEMIESFVNKEIDSTLNDVIESVASNSNVVLIR